MDKILDQRTESTPSSHFFLQPYPYSQSFKTVKIIFYQKKCVEYMKFIIIKTTNYKTYSALSQT